MSRNVAAFSCCTKASKFIIDKSNKRQSSTQQQTFPHSIIIISSRVGENDQIDSEILRNTKIQRYKKKLWSGKLMELIEV